METGIVVFCKNKKSESRIAVGIVKTERLAKYLTKRLNERRMKIVAETYEYEYSMLNECGIFTNKEEIDWYYKF